MKDHWIRLGVVGALVGLFLMPVVAQAQINGTPSISMDPFTRTNQEIRLYGLPPGSSGLLYLGGVNVSGGGFVVGDDGSVGIAPEVDGAPASYPRSIEVTVDGLTLAGIELQTEYPRLIGLSPAGLVLINPPQKVEGAGISGGGLPAACEGANFVGISATRAAYLGGGPTSADGSWNSVITFYPELTAPAQFVWQGAGSCFGRGLRGASAGGVSSISFELEPFTVPSPSMTILETPRQTTAQFVRGSDLPADSRFLLYLGGVQSNLNSTQADGTFLGLFTVPPGAPEALPRSLTLLVNFEGGPGPQVFRGTELAGAYPHAIELSPSGAVTLVAPSRDGEAVISGGGFPPDCFFCLSAVFDGSDVGVGCLSSEAHGTWGPGNSNFPPEAGAASAYVARGFASCASHAFRANNPGGAYPRTAAFTPDAVPVANAGPDVTLECIGASTPVTLDGSASSDADGDSLRYTWYGDFPEGNGTITGSRPTVTLPLGTSTVVLVVNDGTVDSDFDEMNVTKVSVDPEGLLPPLGALTPEGTVPVSPGHAFRVGSTLPLRLRLPCGGGAVTPPRIVALVRDGDALDLNTLDLDTGQSNDSGVSFRFSNGLWLYNMGTTGLRSGAYTLRLEMPDGRRFDAGFVLR
jgi:hypothetical protein